MKYIILFFGFSFLISCTYSVETELYPEPNCDTSAVTYSQSVKPLIDSKCNSCHNAISKFGNVILENHADVLVYVNNGSFIGSIKHLSGFSAMPQGGGKLPDCDISKIDKWLADGAPNN